MKAHWHSPDGEPLCEEHAEGEGDLASNEVDAPHNCSACSRPCAYTLTTEGVEYVIEKIRETLDEGPDEWNRPCQGGTASYYHGSRHVEIVRDWAADLKTYGLNDDRRWLVDYFLKVTEKTHG